MADTSDSDGEPHSKNQSDSDINRGDTMNGRESAITVRPNSMWVNGKAPKFQVAAIGNDALAPDRILRAKRLIFGTIAEPEAEVTQFSPIKLEYPFLSSINSYEWLSKEANGPIPPYQDIKRWDQSQDPPRSVRSYVQLAAVSSEF